MGLVDGAYDAKDLGFLPGSASLHNCVSGHGPDAETLEKASVSDTSKPMKIDDTMAFMFQTRTPTKPTQFALETAQLQADYSECWQGLSKHFNPEQR